MSLDKPHALGSNAHWCSVNSMLWEHYSYVYGDARITISSSFGNLFITLVGCLFAHNFNKRNEFFKPEVTNMRPAKEFPAAREHFGETSTFKHFFPV